MTVEQQEPFEEPNTSMEQNRQNTPEKRLVFIDGDRCFWHTERFTDIVYEKLEVHGISRGRIMNLKDEIEATGGALDTFAILREVYDGAIIDQVAEQVEAEASSRQDLPYEDERCLLMPGARELLQSIPPENRVFLTKGGEETQLIKLRGIAGVNTSKDRYVITDREDKAMMLVDSFIPNKERFVFRWVRNAKGDIEATHVVLVEDKGRAFLGLEVLGDAAKGYWYQHPSMPLLLSQELPQDVGLPSNVEKIDSLYAARDGITVLGRTALKKTTNS